MSDRDRLIELLKDTPMLDVLYRQDEEWESAADHLLANDVTKVVRCKDCKHWEALGGRWDNNHHRKDGRCNALVRFHDSERYCTMEDHFCGYGKLKELGK